MVAVEYLIVPLIISGFVTVFFIVITFGVVVFITDELSLELWLPTVYPVFPLSFMLII